VRSIDTNILARFLVRDDPVQTGIVDTVMGSEVLLTATVLLETAWLLASRYRQSRSGVAKALTEVIRMNNVTVIDEARLLWAIGRMENGADFADMLHLIESRDAGLFTTFDRALARSAGPEAPIAIETLNG
jgi:predicted nucleic-acid-binding protein